jgi:hypothetical protein
LRPPIVYYPGGLSWEEAIGVELEPGKVKDRLTITVPRINENVLTVILPPPDATITDVAVSVLRESPLAVQRLDLNAEGIGTLKGIVPGRYFVAAKAASRDKQWAAFEVVDFVEDSYEARLQLLPTGSIAGRIVTAAGHAPAARGRHGGSVVDLRRRRSQSDRRRRSTGRGRWYVPHRQSVRHSRPALARARARMGSGGGPSRPHRRHQRGHQRRSRRHHRGDHRHSAPLATV